MPHESPPGPPAADRRSADIIPFPVRRAADADPGRLDRALASLNAALAEQQAAMGRWCDSLAALRLSSNRLGDSLSRYDASLASLESNVLALNAQARALERWADTTLAAGSA